MTRERRALIFAALVAPLPLLLLAQGWLADDAARALAAAIGRLPPPPRLEEAPPLPTEWVEPVEEPPTAPSPEEGPAVDPAAPTRPAPPRTSAAAPAARRPTKGLYLSRDRVSALSAAGVRPTGAPVPATATRPAGVAMIGVGGLGVGLVDGDVLTHVAGVPVTNEGDVVHLVTAARGQRAPAIGGVFWRGDEPWQITVEQPYRVAPTPESAPPAPPDPAASTAPAPSAPR